MEVSRLKGQQGETEHSRNRAAQTGTSSEKERREPKDWHKSSKKQQPHHRQEKLEAGPQTLPADAEFKGYEKVVAQDLRISSDNVEFLKAKYYSRQQRQNVFRPNAARMGRRFGLGSKAPGHHLRLWMQPGAAEIGGMVRQHGSAHFSGEISNPLVTNEESFHAEKADIYDAGTGSSPWQHLDATSTRAWTGRISIAMWSVIRCARHISPRRAGPAHGVGAAEPARAGGAG